jgi:hypothetical protein
MKFEYRHRDLLHRERIGQHWFLTFDNEQEMKEWLRRRYIYRENMAGLRRDDGGRVFRRGEELSNKLHCVDWHDLCVVLETVRDPMEDMR